MGFSSGGSAGSIAGATDVALNNPANNQVLTYNSSLGKWQNLAISSGAQALGATVVKTAAYTAVPGDLIPVDASSGVVAITLPATPADKSRVYIKKIDTSVNAVTVTAGASDVFNKASGATSISLTILNYGVNLQYNAATAIWYVVGDDLPLSQLDLRYVSKAGDTMIGPLVTQTASNTNGVVVSTTSALSTDNVYILVNGRARFGYSGSTGGVYIDDNGTNKPIYFTTNGSQVLRLSTTTGNAGANYVTLSNNAAGSGVTLSAAGTDTNIPITISPKGSGATVLKNVQIASGASSGYILTSDSAGNASWQAVSGSTANSLVTPNVQTAAYTLVLSDAGKAVEINSSSAVSVTIPPSSSANFTIGSIIEIFQRGTGQVTVTGGAGVSIRSSASSVLRTQYSVATLRLSATDDWVLAGDLV